jgi:hypothetical protein
MAADEDDDYDDDIVLLLLLRLVKNATVSPCPGQSPSLQKPSKAYHHCVPIYSMVFLF